MKILITDRQGANHFIALSWAHSLQMMGHQIYLWNDQEKSTFDAFYEFTPDIFIGSSWQLNRSTIKCLTEYKDCLILLSVSNWSDFDKEINRELFPIHFASDEEKANVNALKQARPDFQFVFAQYHDKYVSETINKWESLGLTPFGLPLGADIADYYLTAPDKKFKADIVFVGGYWPYKAREINKFILPLLYPNTTLNVKLFGGNYPSPQSLGYASESTIRKFYATSTICPAIYEPHSIEYGWDVSQRPFQILACGGFCLSQKVKSLQEDLYPDGGICYFDDFKDYTEKINHFLKKSQDRLDYIMKGVEQTYTKNTFLHRVAVMFDKLGFTSEAQNAIAIANGKYEEIVYNYKKEMKNEG